MKTNPYCCLLLSVFSFLVTNRAQAQYWDPDMVSTVEMVQTHTGDKYGLALMIDGNRTDSVPAIYDYVALYENYRGYGYMGNKDKAWYKLEPGKAAVLVPAQKYLGFGYFLAKKGNCFSVYSLAEETTVLDNITECGTDLDEVIPGRDSGAEGLNSLRPVFKDDMANNEVWFRNAKGDTYWLSPYGNLYVKNAAVTEKKVNGKMLCGLSHTTYNGTTKELLPPVYDKIELYSKAFALKGSVYDVYSTVVKKIAESEEPLFLTGTTLVPIKKKSKWGLVTPFGKELLPAVFDTICFDGLTIACKKDSVFFYDVEQLITAKTRKPGATYSVKGNATIPPMYVHEISGEAIRPVFVYNPLDRSVVNTDKYTDLFFFGIFKGQYRMAARYNGRYGLIDLKGNTVEPFGYDTIGKGLFMDYKSDSPVAHLAVKNGKTGIVNNELKSLLPFEYDGITGLKSSERMMPDVLALKKGKQWYYYRYADKYLSPYGFDTICINSHYSSNLSWYSTEPTRGRKDGKYYSLDSTGRAYFDFHTVAVEESGPYVILRDSTESKVPVDLTPGIRLTSVEELNAEKSYALVSSQKRYFYVNTYGEVSAGFESFPEYYDPQRQLIFGKKLKKQKSQGLYTFAGEELGQMSKAGFCLQETDMKTREVYYIFSNSKKQRGLMNAAGQLILECKYLDIGSINDGRCTLWPDKNSEPYEVNLKELKPVEWAK